MSSASRVVTMCIDTSAPLEGAPAHDNHPQVQLRRHVAHDHLDGDARRSAGRDRLRDRRYPDRQRLPGHRAGDELRLLLVQRQDRAEDELRGVISHELAHIGNRDILTQSVASAIGAMITYLAYFFLWFGSDDNSPLSLIASLALVLLAPIAASLIQLAISRQREYGADATGAEISGNPESLASALLRLEEGAKAMPMQVNQAAEPLYIVKPFSGGGFVRLFSTHPPIDDRVRRLRQMRPALG